MLSCSAAGNDLLFDESLCEQGRNFSNKIWNALRLIKSWKVDEQLEQPQYAKTADEWFTNIFFQQLEFINDCFSKYRISEALMSIYKLIWDDFCSWYLEIIKPGYEQPIDKYTMAACITNFENLLKLLHPFMPFVTEELWHQLKERNEDDYLIITEWPQTNNFSEDVINTYHFNQRFITAIRNERANKNISPKIKLNVFYHYLDDKNPKVNGAVVKKLENLEKIDNKLYEDQNTSIINVEKVQLFIPLEGMVDKEAEKEKLRKELTYLKGFLLSVDKKLSNERFVKNAPEQVVANEKKKKADAEIKIQNIEKQLASLN
jgi:valyl-tRNA synthetase